MIKKIIDNNKDKWVVLIHPMCGTEKMFSEQMSILEEKYNIVIIRLAGHSLNSKIDDVSFSSVVSEIYEFVQSKKVKISVIGVSLGSMIAVDYAIKYPDTLEDVYIVSPVMGFSNPILRFIYFAFCKIKRFIPKRIYLYFIIKLILYNKQEREFRKRFYQFGIKMNTKFLCKWLDEINLFVKNGKDKIKEISKIKQAKIIYGVKDKMFLNYTKKYLKNKKILTVEEAGHLCNITNYKAFNKIIG